MRGTWLRGAVLIAALLPGCAKRGDGTRRDEVRKAWSEHGSLDFIKKAAARSDSQQEQGATPLVAGALKTIDEVKKLAQHAEPGHHIGSSSLLKHALTGWGNKKQLEEGWKLTHGKDAVHTSAAVREAESASAATFRGGKDSGDGFFDDWGHVAPPAPGNALAAAKTKHRPTRDDDKQTRVPASPGGVGSIDQAESDSSPEPPPLPIFLKDKDPLAGLSQAHRAHHRHEKSQRHRNATSKASGRRSAVHKDHSDGAAKMTHSLQDPIDKAIALHRLQRRKKEAALVSQAQRAAANLFVRKKGEAARKAKAAAALLSKTRSRPGRRVGEADASARVRMETKAHPDVMKDVLRAAEGRSNEVHEVHVNGGVLAAPHRQSSDSDERRKGTGGAGEGPMERAWEETKSHSGAENRKITAVQRLKARKLVYDLKRLLRDAAQSNNRKGRSKLQATLDSVESIDNVIEGMKHKLMSSGDTKMSTAEVLHALESSRHGGEAGSRDGEVRGGQDTENDEAALGLTRHQSAEHGPGGGGASSHGLSPHKLQTAAADVSGQGRKHGQEEMTPEERRKRSEELGGDWLPIPGFKKEVSWLSKRTPKT